MNAEQHRQLDQDGYVLLKRVIDQAHVERLITRLETLWTEERELAGVENYIEQNARRLANLANKGEIFRAVMRHPEVLEVVSAVIGPGIRINMLNAREVPPHSDPRQPFHVDTDHGGKPDEKGYTVCTAIWMLDDFTRQNGATHLVPGTHRNGLLPKEALTDLFAPHPAEVIIEGQSGDVFVFNGHCWHAGGANTTDHSRRAVLVHYIRADQPRRLIAKDISVETAAALDTTERELLGLKD